MTSAGASLTTTLTRRIVFFAVLAMLVQLAVVFSDYYWNDGELSRLFVEQETERLAAGVTAGPAYTLPEELRERYGSANTGYVARVRAASGQVLFASCDEACEQHFLPADVRPPDFWLRTLRPGKPLTLVGGRAFTIGGQTFLVDVAAMGDPANVVSDVLWNEVLAHMIVPMGILLVLVLGATSFSVRRALAPVRAAARAADAIDPMNARSHLPIQGMPMEIAQLAEAVNRAFERVGELMRSQRVLTSGIAHEVRTPLAAIKLELGRIDHPRARKAEADLDELVNFVGQLTALARLDSFDRGMLGNVSLSAICTELVEQFAPWVYDNGHSLELDLRRDDGAILGAEGLLKDAIRNLLDNAVKHTPAGTSIIIRVDGGRLQIEDRFSSGAAGRGGVLKNADGMGIGLKIVQRIAALHGAEFTQTDMPCGRIAQIEFPASSFAAADASGAR